MAGEDAQFLEADSHTYTLRYAAAAPHRPEAPRVFWDSVTQTGSSLTGSRGAHSRFVGQELRTKVDPCC